MNPNDAPPAFTAGNVIGGMIMLAFLIACYFGPTIIAGLAKRRNVAGIFVLNLLLGWTVLGWIIAFIWALLTPAPAVIYIERR